MISVIIPVHNDEDSLAACFVSILAQRGLDYEVILVNNGSTDGSAALCDNFRESNRRVQVIHMEHAGTATALNRGLELASAPYVFFAEAGTCFEEGAFEELEEILSKDYDVIFIPTGESRPEGLWDVSHNNILRRLCQKMPEQLCDKLIRRDLLIGDDIRFTEGIIWENVDFCIKLYLHARSYAAFEKNLFQVKKPVQEQRDAEEAFSRIILTLSKWAGPAESSYEEYGQFIHRWMAAMYCDILVPMYRQMPGEARKIYKLGMRDFRWLLNVRRARRDQLTNGLYLMLGLLPTSYIMSLQMLFRWFFEFLAGRAPLPKVDWTKVQQHTLGISRKTVVVLKRGKEFLLTKGRYIYAKGSRYWLREDRE